MESFFASLKREELYRKKYSFGNGILQAVEDYIEFYNEQRPHAKLQYKTPNQKEREYKENKKILSKSIGQAGFGNKKLLFLILLFYFFGF